jgi:hypothetical protein
MSSKASRMSDYENELAESFEEDHYGHEIAYYFNETGIGTTVSIACLRCPGKAEDITDYESW